MLLVPLSIGAACGCAGDPARRTNRMMPEGTGFQLREVKNSTGTHKYSIFIPADHKPTQRYPAIVFLHGIGEGGSDGKKCTSVGLGPAVADRAATFPFIVIFPQVKGNWKGREKAQLVIDVLDDAKKKYSIDSSRVSLTGLSTGGEGTWLIGARYPDRFAALVPMCAYSAYGVVDQLTSIPIWCFHNGGDPFVSAGGSREMCKRIERAGGDVRYTQYGAFGHNCWDRAYQEGELFSWLLGQRR
jgi:predicted peptidase